jgi:GntR family transcriptional regulator/MocR family aminotransferase
MERAILQLKGTTFELDPDSRQPLYLQLRDGLRRLIMNHSLPQGVKLPSTRGLAKNLAISRNTVVNAYEVLAAEGLVTGAIGSGTRVAASNRLRRSLDLRSVLRDSHFPTNPVPLCDPDGNPLLILSDVT